MGLSTVLSSVSFRHTLALTLFFFRLFFYFVLFFCCCCSTFFYLTPKENKLARLSLVDRFIKNFQQQTIMNARESYHLHVRRNAETPWHTSYNSSKLSHLNIISFVGLLICFTTFVYTTNVRDKHQALLTFAGYN